MVDHVFQKVIVLVVQLVSMVTVEEEKKGDPRMRNSIFCRDCPRFGKYSVTEGSTDVSACVIPTLCSENQYVSSNVCTDCTWNGKGSLEIMKVDLILHVQKLYVLLMYVVSNACTACADGMESAGGDGASGGLMLHVQQHYVLLMNMFQVIHVHHVLLEKQMMLIMMQVEPDTSCTATLCAANEYVSSNTCTPCATGKTNAAGNDASEPDTICLTTCLDTEYESAGVNRDK